MTEDFARPQAQLKSHRYVVAIMMTSLSETPIMRSRSNNFLYFGLILGVLITASAIISSTWAIAQTNSESAKPTDAANSDAASTAVRKGVDWQHRNEVPHTSVKSKAAYRAGTVTCKAAMLTVLVNDIAPAEQIALTLIVAGQSEERIQFESLGTFPDCELVVRDDAGKQIPLSRIGKSIFESPLRMQCALVRLSHGQCRAWTYKFAEAFSGLEPGKYRLSVQLPLSVLEPQADKFVEFIDLSVEDIPFSIK